MLFPRINSIHQVLSALPQHLPLLANPALSLENWTATMNMNTSNMSMTAAAVVFSNSLVSLTTQPLVLDSGRCHRHLLALQTAVAARVSGEDKLVEMFFLIFHTGVVTSPNNPGNYPNNLDKTETIQVEEGLIISLQFTAFDIDDSSSTCRNDHLTITDGDGTTLMEKSCGNSLPAAIRSRSNVVNLVFSTDGGVTYSGWSVSWSAVTPGECQQCNQVNF